MSYIETLQEHLNGYNGRIVDVRLDKITLPDGRDDLREVVVHPGGVGIIAADQDNNVYCVRQFRYPMEHMLLEIPAGKLEYGEEPYSCAVRELEEETGLRAEKFQYLGSIYPSPGYCKETLYLYMATALTQGSQNLDENEFLDVEKIHISKLLDMIMADEIKDAKTAVGILKAARLLEV